MSYHLSEENLEVGDLIEFRRSLGLYSHWAVYIGNGEIIHLSDGSHEAVSSRGDASVRKDKLRYVAGNSPTFRNNELDRDMRPKRKHQIVRRAQQQLGRNRFNLITYNSEHFATECRYGVPRSRQVEEVSEKALETPMSMLSAPNPLATALPGAVGWAVDRLLLPGKGEPISFQ